MSTGGGIYTSTDYGVNWSDGASPTYSPTVSPTASPTGIPSSFSTSNPTITPANKSHTVNWGLVVVLPIIIVCCMLVGVVVLYKKCGNKKDVAGKGKDDTHSNKYTAAPVSDVEMGKVNSTEEGSVNKKSNAVSVSEVEMAIAAVEQGNVKL